MILSKTKCWYVSTLIQNDAYLKLAIIYILQNPLRAGIVKNCREYVWSSANQYFEKKYPEWLDARFMNGLFGSRMQLDEIAGGELRKELPATKTVFGPVLGDESFLTKVLERYERRQEEDPVKKRRRDDFGFEPEKSVGSSLLLILFDFIIKLTL